MEVVEALLASPLSKDHDFAVTRVPRRYARSDRIKTIYLVLWNQYKKRKMAKAMAMAMATAMAKTMAMAKANAMAKG